MSLKAQITEDMKTAMRAKDSERLGTVRLLQAAMKQKEVDERIELDDAAVVAIVDKLIKQRKDSIAAFEQAARQDLADKEKAEMAVLMAYLPERLSAEEVTSAVQAIVTALGASGPGDMGKVMGAVKTQLAGKADMGMVSAAVKAALTLKPGLQGLKRPSPRPCPTQPTPPPPKPPKRVGGGRPATTRAGSGSG